VPDHPLSPWRGTQRSGEPRKSLLRWPCLLPSVAVAVAPLRNLSGDAEQQGMAEGFTDCLVTGLFRRCRGFSFVWLPTERRWTANLAPPNPTELRYVVSGSVQRGSAQGMLRVNTRISDALTADYLRAGRQEFWPEDLAAIQGEITGQISQALHILLLHEESRHASDAELGINDCLARAKAALKGELRAELSAEAQRWFLAALARDPRNVKALVGLAGTCQHLVSNPWWGIRVPPQRRPTSAARRSRSLSNSNRGMPLQSASKACCTPRQDS
jgi:TolB-like protein